MESRACYVRARSVRPLDRRQVECVCEALRSGLQERISLAESAAIAGLSRWHFSRAFHATLGTTFSDFVMNLRIATAMQLMRETDLSLAQIATQSGFGDQSYFSRSFVRAVGIPPFKWRTANHPADILSSLLLGHGG